MSVKPWHFQTFVCDTRRVHSALTFSCLLRGGVPERDQQKMTDEHRLGGHMEIDCVPFASLIIHSHIICWVDFFFNPITSTDINPHWYAVDNHNNDCIYPQWHAPVLPLGIFMRTLLKFFFFSVALVVINLLVRQFRAEEGFSLGVQVWAGKANPLFARWKRLFSLARWWMWCLGGCMALLALSLLCSHYSPLVSVLFCFLFYYVSRLFSSVFSHHTTLSLSSSYFLLSAPTVSHTNSIANYFISPSLFLPSPPPLSPSFPSFMSSCLSFHSGSAVGWATGCNTGHGSCLSSPLVSCVAASGAASLPLCRSACPLLLNWDPPSSWIPPTMELLTLLLALHLALS